MSIAGQRYADFVTLLHMDFFLIELPILRAYLHFYHTCGTVRRGCRRVCG